ncbi:hypothetical protein PSECIP111951_02194 [Pseudoalteromonas holothuriae]|uniref:Beta-lactamase n=1 Tax=Pseudoalteromonas holothuriae TaxID=2963714 RepID=A0ABM9GJX1_9GAMM|nr:tetratricopeptide repeat protein [Pseudoalteromonas sp. CIP111951]CAH9060055.1 hypothetical protein PSECIP111951_02194 [Pseudoalteromonas sp. CIP111951]
MKLLFYPPFFAMLLVIFLLSGCKSTSQLNNPNDEKYKMRVQQFAEQPNKVTYESLLLSFVNSSYVHSIGDHDLVYRNTLASITNQEIACTEVDWFALTQRNFLSIKPHLSAQSCYQSANIQSKAEFHRGAVEFLLAGIKASGNGQHYYSAYQVTTWDDASDFIELSNYQVVDGYASLSHQNQAIYLVYVVNDITTGRQKEIYFENSKFIHGVLGLQYPFSGLGNHLELSVIDSLVVSDNIIAKIAKAGHLAELKKWPQAISLYQNVAQQNSAVAFYRLGMLCLTGETEHDFDKPCGEYFRSSASLGYMNAYVALTYIYLEGAGVVKSPDTASEYITLARQGLSLGDVWYKLTAIERTLNRQRGRLLDSEYLRKAIDYDSAPAKFYQLIESQNIEQEVQIAQLKKLAQTGFAPAQTSYARMLLASAKKGSKAWQQAQLWLDKATEQYYPNAFYLKGIALQNGLFDKPDKIAAYLAFQKAALVHHAQSQWRLGYYHSIGDVVEQDHRLAGSWYSLCSLAGNSNCLFSLGIHFRNGLAIEKDDRVAFKYFEQAAQKGHKMSKFYLATMYLQGAGVDKNIDKALSLYQQACDESVAKACIKLALIYRSGDLIGVNNQRANKLFDKACQLKNMDACNYLAQAYQSGLSVGQNLKRAIELYTQACESRKQTESCFSLAQLYQQGHGVSKSIDDAKYYYQIACVGYNQQACENHKKLLDKRD